MPPSMNGSFVTVSGSARQSCPADKLDGTSQFVWSFTREVLMLGGGTVVPARVEAGNKDEHCAPRVTGLVGISRG